MPESLQVLLATDSAEPSGLGQHMLMLGRGLARTHRVTLAFPEAAAGFAASARVAGLEARTFAAAAEALLLDALRPDVLHVHAGIGWEGHALVAAGAAVGVRVVRTEHLPWLITEPGQEADYAAGAAAVDAVIAVSDAAAASWAPALARLRPGARLAAIRNGIEPPSVMRSRVETRAALGIAEGAPLLLSVGRFTPQKNQRSLIRAVRLLHRRGIRPWLLLVGDGPERAGCEAEAAGCDRIRFLDTRGDVGDLMRAADLLVLPSRFEGLPLVVLEAMALGLPVVASRIDSTVEALGSGHPWFAAPGDVESLGAAIAAALAAPAEAKAVAAAQLERFAAHFMAERMIAETASLYRSVLRAAARRRRGIDMSRLKVGFIGAGGIAQRHLGVLETFADVEVAGIADPEPERARATAARMGAQAFGSHEEMLAALELDALWICVPPFAHGAPERAAIELCLPFLVEKPISLDAGLAREIEAGVRRAGVVTAVGYHWRYLDIVDEARRLLRDNPAHLMAGHWLDQTPPPDWWQRDDRSGGQIVEQATHIIDLARFLAGEVTDVYGLAARRERPDFPGLDVPTASIATLRFASGAIATLSATCVLRWSHRIGLHVFADALALELTDRDLMVDVGRGRPVRTAEGDPVWRLDRAFVDAVRGGENRIRTPYAEALKTHLVALAVADSMRTGVPVRMEGLLAEPQPVFRPAAAEGARVA